MGDLLVRCRTCGGQAQATNETTEDGGWRLVAPTLCPRCNQPLVFDVLGPVEVAGLDTSDQDTPVDLADRLAQLAEVPVIRVTAGAYGEAFSNGLDLRSVTPTGAGGVIVVTDIMDALIARASQGEVLG